MPEILTIREAVHFTRISEWKLRQLVAAGVIPHFRPGGSRRILFRKASLESWIISQETEAAQRSKFR
jgi:excisionase family DNA binding protein